MRNHYSTTPADSQAQGKNASLVTPWNVTVIPATKNLDRNRATLNKRMGGLRVAAYCRVSTGDESQQTSYRNQVNYYTGLIMGHISWSLAGVYADKGLSGTSSARRVNFNRMLQDARDGKIDYIITKSISRFARNTVTTLSLVRELRSREQPVGIFFEKEQIDSLDPTGDLILSIMSALAQEESESISRNIRWSLQKKQRAGIPQVNLGRMLGYDKGENGVWLINEPQAKIVRDIFARYLGGASANGIAAGLNESGVLTLAGKKWTASAVIRILRNEKYAGDLLMQKTFTADVLSHRPVVNRGQMPRFYITDHHAPIIPRGDWNRVQLLMDGKEWNLNEPGQREKKDRPEHGAGKPRGRSAHVFKNLTFFDSANNGAGNGLSLRRCTYSRFVNLRTGNLNAAGDGDMEQETRYSYSVPMWVVSGQNEPQQENRRKGEPADAVIPHALCECALEQSFMEMLYICRWDLLQNREDSLIEKLFELSCRKPDRMSFGRKENDTELKRMEEQMSQTWKELESLNARIKEARLAGMNRLAGGMKREEWEAISGKRETYRQRLAALKCQEEKLKAEAARPQMYRDSHEKFLGFLRNLPDVNAAGIPLRIRGRGFPEHGDSGKAEVIAEKDPLDWLPFDRAAYSAFIRSGTVYGDTVEYETNFGIKLVSSGNARTLADFIGYQRCQADGTVELLDQEWKVNGRPLHRADVRRSRKRKAGEETTEAGKEAGRCAL